MAVLLPVVSFAQVNRKQICGSDSGSAGELCFPQAPSQAVTFSDYTVEALVARILNIALLFVGLIALVFIVIGGYRYIMAGGNEESVGKAKQTIMNAVIGLIIVILAFAIVNITYRLLKDEPPVYAPGSGQQLNPADRPGFTPPPRID
ncbi:MAG: hypothetical protein A3J48_00300 [Candidatus Doudnabacteria bacterium RIFCSPHIGHO2_02_FULL_46_11]|uniref:Uncharacterized protein n=1 Tax=Candidatus Doudnabacteria bacterium RIFCSPHIGHO2_02_FULL_46_11 TaxID=1817832 RepID=A0A1F5P6Z8_9BACT|nr:MAG: hypothetical protein A3J48_00300 [Candidatus Doudnabacteria bacterium RIFCSPHIGHO2_02_FULL_46_11]